MDVEDQTLANIVGGALDEVRGIRDAIRTENAAANKELVAIVADVRKDSTKAQVDVLLQVSEIKDEIKADRTERQAYRESERAERAAGRSIYKLVGTALVVLAVALMLFGGAAFAISLWWISR